MRAVAAGIVISCRRVKSIRFLPLTFVAGMHGFALFVPYLVLVVAATLILRRRPLAAARMSFAEPAAVR
jgi:hypothetical protein